MPRGVVLIALAAVSWGTTGSVTTVLVARAGVDPWVIGAARMWIAAALLLVATRLMGARLPMGRGHLGAAFVLGACMAAFQVTYFTAVTMTGSPPPPLAPICRPGHDRGARRPRAPRASAEPCSLDRLACCTALLVTSPPVAPAAPRLALGSPARAVCALSYP